jgi:hypothetical protein
MRALLLSLQAIVFRLAAIFLSELNKPLHVLLNDANLAPTYGAVCRVRAGTPNPK